MRALLLLGAVFAAPAWVPEPPATHVTDRAGVLSPDTETSLEHRLADYEARSGHQVVVWIDRTTGDVPIEEFAAKTFEAWGIGRAGLDDGLAIFAMTEDRALRIEVGYELESRVTDMVASKVIRTTMIPLIQRGEWDAAIEDGVEALVDTIEGRAGARIGRQDGRPGPGPGEEPELSPLAKLVGVVLLGLFVVLLITHPRRALMLLVLLGRGAAGGGPSAGGGGFRGGGGRSGGGGATGRW